MALSPVPYESRIIEGNGRLSTSWTEWLNELRRAILSTSSGGGGSGTDLSVESGGTEVDDAVAVLDFNADFTITESPDHEINISLDLGSINHNSLLNAHNLTTDIDHNLLTNYSIDEHRLINDSGTSVTELWSASKIDSELSGKANVSHSHISGDISDFNEAAQDAVGGIITDSSTINFTYDDVANTITGVTIDSAIDHNSLLNYNAAEHFTVDDIDHGSISGLGDDDHTQYLTETRHDALAADNPHSVTITQAITADSGTDITTTELETLTSGGDASSLHFHVAAPDPLGFKIIRPTTGSNVEADAPEDTLTIASGDRSIIVTGDAASDTLDFEVDEGFVDHDSLLNFVANEHIDWTSATQNFLTTGTAQAGNLQLNANSLISTDTDGDILFAPNGTGQVLMEGVDLRINYPSSTIPTFFVDSGAYRVGIGTVTPAALLDAQYPDGFPIDASIRVRSPGTANFVSMKTVAGSTSTQTWDQGSFSKATFGGAYLWQADGTAFGISMSILPGVVSVTPPRFNVGTGLTTHTTHTFHCGDAFNVGTGMFWDGLTVNEGGGSTNGKFRVEGAGDANLLETDAVNATVQVGAAVAADSAKFFVDGKISCATECEINGDLNHDGTNIGFYGVAPVARPDVTGSRGGNVALQNLLTALASQGLITDSTT